MKLIARLLIAFLALVAYACGPPATTNPTDTENEVTVYEFADADKLQSHWLKHRGEFDTGLTEAQYLAKAQAFFNDRSPEKQLKSRGNGDELHYLPRTNEFGVLSSKDTIRTYFRPSSGRGYWERQ